MTDVEEIRIVSNKIDRLEDFALPSQNSVKSLILEGNHILEVPSLSALQQIHVEKVTVVKNHFPCNCRVIYLLESVLGRSEHFLNRYVIDSLCINLWRFRLEKMQTCPSPCFLKHPALLKLVNLEGGVCTPLKSPTPLIFS